VQREGQVPSRKRKLEDMGTSPKAKKTKKQKDGKTMSSILPFKAGGPKVTVTLKLGPKPKEPEDFPCCLCVSMSREGLLPLYDPSFDSPGSDVGGVRGMAHEKCANIVPETWVDDYETDVLSMEGTKKKLRAVFGVDGIVKDRWNLVRAIITLSTTISKSYSRRNVQLVQGPNRRLTELLYSVQRASVLRPSTSPVQVRARSTG
jgi:hypothetical protein